jgi:membrane associated rhomboid family serine protease
MTYRRSKIIYLCVNSENIRIGISVMINADELCFITIALIFLYITLFVLDHVIFKGRLFIWGCEKSFNNMRRKEWYRLVTGSFFHINILHLLSNSLAIYYVGIILENRIGSVNFLFIYLIGNIAASLIQSKFTSFSGGCGASPGIFALIACILVLHVYDQGFLNLHLGTWSLDYIICYFFLGNLIGYTGLIVHSLGFNFGIVISTILLITGKLQT